MTLLPHQPRDKRAGTRRRLWQVVAVFFCVALALAIDSIALANPMYPAGNTDPPETPVPSTPIETSTTISTPIADQSVLFEQRNYNLTFQENGDVQVDEHWQVLLNLPAVPPASGAPYEYSIEVDIPLGNVRDVVVNRVMLGEKTLRFSSFIRGMLGSGYSDAETARAHGDPPITRDVNWNTPASLPGPLDLDILYTLQGAIGFNEQVAWFDRHFLDEAADDVHFSSIVSSVLTIAWPSALSPDGVQVTAVDQDNTPVVTRQGQQIQISASHLDARHSFEMEAAFPRGALDATVQRPDWQSSDAPPGLPTPAIEPGKVRFYSIPRSTPCCYATDPVARQSNILGWFVLIIILIGVLGLWLLLGDREIFPDS